MREIHWEDRAVLRSKEVCEILGIKRATLIKWCKVGHFSKAASAGTAGDRLSRGRREGLRGRLAAGQHLQGRRVKVNETN